jgi:hypothetical protein
MLTIRTGAVNRASMRCLCLKDVPFDRSAAVWVPDPSGLGVDHLVSTVCLSGRRNTFKRNVSIGRLYVCLGDGIPLKEMSASVRLYHILGECGDHTIVVVLPFIVAAEEPEDELV